MTKPVIGVLFGGHSGEASVSAKSAANVFELVDINTYQPYLLELDNSDNWWLHHDGIKWPIENNQTRQTGLVFNINEAELKIDLVCNVIHGSPGEDGQLQKFLDSIQQPYTGSNAAAMAKTFDKEQCNKILTEHNLPVAQNYIHRGEITLEIIDDIENKLGPLPYFVKPNSGGSSIASGIAQSEPELFRLITKALGVDKKVMIEKFLNGREFSVGVIEYNNVAQALPITEIISENAQ